MANVIHGLVKPIGQPGKPDRQWQCMDCKVKGTLGEVMKVSCSKPSKVSSGQRLLNVLRGKE